jgi:hypothetical protein
MGEMRNAYSILVRWGDNIRMGLREIGWESVDWSHEGSGEGPVVGSCKHSNEPPSSIKGGEFLDELSVYERLKNSVPRREGGREGGSE